MKLNNCQVICTLIISCAIVMGCATSRHVKAERSQSEVVETSSLTTHSKMIDSSWRNVVKITWTWRSYYPPTDSSSIGAIKEEKEIVYFTESATETHLRDSCVSSDSSKINYTSIEKNEIKPLKNPTLSTWVWVAIAAGIIALMLFTPAGKWVRNRVFK